MSKGSSIYLWSVNVPMDQFPDAGDRGPHPRRVIARMF
jgi:hypothetical protein